MTKENEISIKLSDKLITPLLLLSNAKGCSIDDLIQDAILEYSKVSITKLANNEFNKKINGISPDDIDIVHPYYVYVYLDPNVEGDFEHMGYKFNHQPVYVGKGVGGRLNEHTEGRSHSEDMDYWVSQLKDRGQLPIIVKVESGLTSLNAHLVEGRLIKDIGRRDAKSGPLLNRTGGWLPISDNTGTRLADSNVLKTLSALNKYKSLEEAAHVLGISVRTIYRMKVRYSIKRDDSGVWYFTK